MPEKVTIGFDWSMNSPSICIHVGSEWNINNCKFKYFTGAKKCHVNTDQIEGWPIPIYNSNDDLDRWIQNSNWAGARISIYQAAFLGMEGYSYGSRGSLPFSIAENTAILKYTIRKIFPEQTLNIFAPGAIKKFASGKGNSDKIKMFEAFLAETGLDLTKIIPVGPGGNPISDIVDSYYIAKLTHYECTKV